jgi:Plasma-membrane choline transporter
MLSSNPSYQILVPSVWSHPSPLLILFHGLFATPQNGYQIFMIHWNHPPSPGCLGLFSFAIGICYAVAVRPRIPFAAANLNTALTAVKANMGLTVIAYLVMFLALGWSIFWFMGVGGALASGNGGIVFLLFLSYYWTHQVLSNTVHVTTAGTVGTWWFVPDEASSCCSPAIRDSFCRATTYSFGSICLGSFLVAIVQALRALAHQLRDNEEMQILLCIVDCILACIQDIIEYFNMYAYVYVGLYGFGYIEAGRNVMQLFQQKGWTVIINDDLGNRVLLMVSVGIGFLTGFVGLALALADHNLLSGLAAEEGGSTAASGFFIGMIVGFVFSSILLSVVSSAINTVIVCFAESPAEFEANHPQLSATMRSAWTAAWPELTF